MNHHFFTMAGTHHQGNEDLNQDFGSAFGLPDGCGCIVAGGMGGQHCGWDAFRIAVSSAASMLERCVIPSCDEFYDVAVKASFAAACNKMIASVREDEAVEDYGTTSMMAILAEGGELHYGFVGDGAMIALLGNSRGVKLVTLPQIGERYGRGLLLRDESYGTALFDMIADLVAEGSSTTGGNPVLAYDGEVDTVGPDIVIVDPDAFTLVA